MVKKVRVRVHIAGELVEDIAFPVGVGNREMIGDLAQIHAETCVAADRAGKPYLVDLEFWDGEHFRFGTDDDGMVRPLEVALADLLEALEGLE